MQILKPSVSIYLDSRREKKSGVYPVKLRITFNRIQKYYPISIDLNQTDFVKILNSALLSKVQPVTHRKELQHYKMKIDSFLVRSKETVDMLSSFTFKAFENAMFEKVVTHNDVYKLFEETIQNFDKTGQLGTKSNYQCSLNSLKKFKKKLKLEDVTVEFLQAYEKWLLNDGKSISTVGIYLRPLRAILNMAIEHGNYLKDDYPFTRRKYQIPASKNIKKALTQEEVGKIYQYDAPSGSWLQRARDMWMFSYFSNGMNIKDVALLKHSNIEDDYIIFNRAKTQSTNRRGSKPISIFITPELREIIERWKTSKNSIYLFDIITSEQNLYIQKVKITQYIKMINKYMGIISENLQLNKKVTTYYARHSFATILRRSGASTEFISESLGHSSLATTSSYLDSFENRTKMEWAKKISNFG